MGRLSTFVIILIIIGAVLLFFVVLGIIAGIRFYNIALNRSYTRGRVSTMTKNPDPDKPLTQKNDFHEGWFDEMSAKEIFLTSYDGLRLSAFLVENSDNNCGRFAILCHGYTGFPQEMGFQAIRFYEQGFSLLVPAARSHGHSEGHIFDMGWKARHDVIGWIKYLNDHYDQPEIILYGISMGGATVMMTAGEDLPANVKCAVEDCGYSSIYAQYRHSLVNMMGIPAFPFMFYLILTVRLMTGVNIRKEGYSTRQLAHSKIPVFFVHGTDDRYVPFPMLKENYASHPGPKEMLAIENAPHIASPWMGGDLYWERVMSFVNKYTD